MVEAMNSLYKAELFFLGGPWNDRHDVEVAATEWLNWFNTDRLHTMLN